MVNQRLKMKRMVMVPMELQPPQRYLKLNRSRGQEVDQEKNRALEKRGVLVLGIGDGRGHGQERDLSGLAPEIAKGVLDPEIDVEAAVALGIEDVPDPETISTKRVSTGVAETEKRETARRKLLGITIRKSWGTRVGIRV